jgi:hypothetical protein
MTEKWMREKNHAEGVNDAPTTQRLLPNPRRNPVGLSERKAVQVSRIQERCSRLGAIRVSGSSSVSGENTLGCTRTREPMMALWPAPGGGEPSPTGLRWEGEHGTLYIL